MESEPVSAPVEERGSRGAAAAKPAPPEPLADGKGCMACGKPPCEEADDAVPLCRAHLQKIASLESRLVKWAHQARGDCNALHALSSPPANGLRGAQRPETCRCYCSLGGPWGPLRASRNMQK